MDATLKHATDSGRAPDLRDAFEHPALRAIKPAAPAISPRRAWRSAILAGIGWTLAIAVSTGWNVSQEERKVVELARAEAVGKLDRDLAFRRWATSHGGVYVPVGPSAMPNPRLAHLPHRDVDTDFGALTLFNPATVVRDMEERFPSLLGVRTRITSFTALYPSNAPDAWERRALEALRAGAREFSELTSLGDRPYLRLMRPLTMETGCLKCHAGAARPGEIMGGTDVAIPLSRYDIVKDTAIRRLLASHGGLWIIGLVAIGGIGHRSKLRAVERENAIATIQKLAYFDAATSLPNRRLLHEHLEFAIPLARRQGRLLALVYLDLDHFKNVNDTHGHLVGDGLLAAVGERIRTCVRDEDIVARIGGDEFAILLASTNRVEGVLVVAEKLITTLGERFVVEDHQIFMSGSLGISVFPNDAETPADLLRNADMALFHAKEQGRNTFRFFSRDIDARMQERHAFENGLRNALQRNEFFLEYQPKVVLESGKVFGFEALLRWSHPSFGLVPPDRFIALAEETRLIQPIGDWVLAQALADLVRWQEAGYPDVAMSINVSAVQLIGRDFAAIVRSALDATGIDPARLELEITESVLMHHDMVARLQALADLGLEISVDDFGTGYSSLSYLKRFPVSTLKIDRSFVRDLPGDPEDLALSRAVIALGASLGIKVVAEGIETSAQANALLQLGCRAAQGYLFGRPMRAGDVVDFLAGHDT